MPTPDDTQSLREPDSTASFKRPLQRVTSRIVASLLIGGGFLWLLLRGGLPLLPSEQALRDLPYGYVALYLTFHALAALVRAYRWTYLIGAISASVPKLRVMGVCLVGFSAIFFAPLRSGEIVRPYLISRDKRVSFMQAAGAVGAERVIDGLVLTLCTLVALSTATIISPLPSSLGDLPLPVSAIPAAVYSAVLVFAAAFAVMIAFYVARETTARLTRRLLGLVSVRLGDWAAITLGRLADGLSFLPSRGNLLRFLRATLGYWALSILAQWVLLRGLGLEATVAQATTTVGVQGLGLLVPAGPGMFGAYQIAGFSSLAMFFPMPQVKTAGALFIFISYTSQLLLNAVQLAAGFLLMAKADTTARPVV